MSITGEQVSSTATRLLAGFVADDAISILREDHRRIDELFRQFDKARTDGQRADLARRVCAELLVHACVEGEIFYPALREAIDVGDLMDEADIEHDAASRLIGEIMAMAPGDGHYCARVKVLGDYVRHHMQQEQNRMFSKAREARLDVRALGEQILARKKELQRGLNAQRPMAVRRPERVSGLQLSAMEAL
jgi:hemerythrin superfamily protein